MLLYNKPLYLGFGDDGLSILVRDVDRVDGHKAVILQPFAA